MQLTASLSTCVRTVNHPSAASSTHNGSPRMVIMNRYRQYRMIQKVKKLLDTPVTEEVYTPSDRVYLSTNSSLSTNSLDTNSLSTKSLSLKDSILDPRCTLRMKQVEAVARLLLQQIGRLQELYAGDCHQSDSNSKNDINGTLIEIEILFEELDSGLLWTEAEKATRRLQGDKSRLMGRWAEGHAEIDLNELVKQIQAWQQEKSRRKKRFNRVESSIRELALNVNDIRCTQILRDRKTSIAALDSALELGVPLLKDIFHKLQCACANLEPKA